MPEQSPHGVEVAGAEARAVRYVEDGASARGVGEGGHAVEGLTVGVGAA
jgi:hypothetical protein